MTYWFVGEWKVRDIQSFLEALCEHCKELKGLNLSGWKGITPDHLKYLTTESKRLERLDLSSINVNSQFEIMIKSNTFFFTVYVTDKRAAVG